MDHRFQCPICGKFNIPNLGLPPDAAPLVSSCLDCANNPPLIGTGKDQSMFQANRDAILSALVFLVFLAGVCAVALALQVPGLLDPDGVR